MSYYLESDFIKYSGNFGIIDINSKPFDDSKDLGGTEDSVLQYLIKSIRIYTGKKDGNIIIGGIQLSYRNLKSKELRELPIRKGKIEYEDEDIETFELKSGEYLTNFYIRFENDGNYIYQIGFETNKKRKIIKGCEKGEDKCEETNGGQNIIFGTFGHYNLKLDSCGILYINIKEYLKRFKFGYFELKFLMKKDEKFKKEIESKYDSLSESDKYLFKICFLPDVTFNEIMKYCIL